MFVVSRLESPTRTLTLEAPRGVEISAGVGDFTASCRKDLLLQSSEGEVSAFGWDQDIWEGALKSKNRKRHTTLAMKWKWKGQQKIIELLRCVCVCACVSSDSVALPSVGSASLKYLIRLMSVINPSDLVLLSPLLLSHPHPHPLLFGRSDFIKGSLMRFPVTGCCVCFICVCVCVYITVSRYLAVKLFA